MLLKCGCQYDEKKGSFAKYCKEHGLKLLQDRFKKAQEKNNATANR